MTLRIIYVSTLKPEVNDTQIAELVATAAAFNKAHEITGVLALEGQRVCQILEGPDDAVNALYASIRSDPRHSGLAELVHAPIDAPTFEAWGMVRRPMIDIVMKALTL